MIKHFDYTNKLGKAKRLDVNMEKRENGKYLTVLWEMTHGEFCGDAEMTAEEINDLLSNYGLSFTE